MTGQLARYYWLKERGFCVQCGCERAVPGRTLCAACTKRQAKRIRKRTDKADKKGLCRHCLRRPAAEGRKCCAVCLERSRKYMQKKRKEMQK